VPSRLVDRQHDIHVALLDEPDGGDRLVEARDHALDEGRALVDDAFELGALELLL
jgi:hypothetical protein